MNRNNWIWFLIAALLIVMFISLSVWFVSVFITAIQSENSVHDSCYVFDEGWTPVMAREHAFICEKDGIYRTCTPIFVECEE